MSKFKSHEEYDDWRSQQAIKRQGAKDLAKLDAENPVYVTEKKRAAIGLPGYLVIAAVAFVSVLAFTAAGKEFLERIAAFLSRPLR